MAASFAVYASQYLNRQQKDTSSASSSSQQPLFFSFTTDEGSRALQDHDIEMDDEGDPHLRNSDMHSTRNIQDIDDESPYLRLDEEELQVAGGSRRNFESLTSPFIASERHSSSMGPTQGWLAHQTSPMSPRIPSPPPSDLSSDSNVPLTDLVNATTPRPVDPPPQTRTHLSLTESLLPRDGHSRPVDIFSLPDPRHLPRGRSRNHDSVWTAIWCLSVSMCFFGSILIVFTTSKPRNAPRGTILPYTTLLHTIPLLTILTFISAGVSYVHIMFLRIFVRPVLVATSVSIPVTLFISAVWAFIGSFMWDGDSEPSWGETVGLRIFSIFPLLLAIYTSRRLLTLPQEIHSTSAILTLVTRLLLANPFLLALSPVILLISLIASIPFLTLAFRLLLIGRFAHPFAQSNVWEWHVRQWAGWAIWGTVAVWLWSWAVGRGVLRTTCAAVVGAWYFSPAHIPPPPPQSTHRIHAALFRATSTSFGTVVLSALLLTGIRLLALLTALLRRAPMPILPWLSLPLSMLGNLSSSLSTYALVYAGLTGDAFFPSARRARALTAATSNYKHGITRPGADSSLAILSLTPLTLTLPFALTAYLFVAHTLASPDYAPVAALLAGGVTALVGMFCVGLVEDTADALYICYCIDRDVGEMHREDVFNAFERRAQRHPSPPVALSQISSELDPEQFEELQRERGREPALERSPILNESMLVPNRDVYDNPEDEDSPILPGSDFFD